MSVTRRAHPQAVSSDIPAVPLTLEGYSVLHQIMRFRWRAWRALPASEKTQLVQEAVSALTKIEQSEAGQSGLYSLLGH